VRRLTIDQRTSLFFALIGIVWITVSDRMLRTLVFDPDVLTRIQTYKGWGFILGSSLVLYALLRADRLGREAAETALRNSEARFRSITERMSDVVYVRDENFQISYVSPSVKRVLGYDPSEVVGMALYPDLVDPESYQAVLEAQEKLSSGQAKNIEHLEARFRRKDGATAWLDVEATPIFITGEFRGVQVIGRDITERKLAEEELRQLGEELAQAGRVLALGELSTSIAHELNQPLAAMLSNAQAARRFLDRDPPELAEVRLALEDIERDDRHAGRIIQRLRAFINRAEIRRDPVDLNEIGREVLRLVRAEAASRGVMTISRFTFSKPTVRGDRVALQQVLLNLVLNALDAAQQSPPGERQVTVSSRREDSGAIAITVTDTGPGVDPQQLGRLFEPFFTTKVGGIGLGLSLSRSLVEAHGGEVWAERNPNGGMTFGFRIPVAAREQEAEA